MNAEIKALLQALIDGKVLQNVRGSEWIDMTLDESLNRLRYTVLGDPVIAKTRVKPATILINGIEVPAYASVAPAVGTIAFVLQPGVARGYDPIQFLDGEWCALLLNRNEIWLKEEHIKEAIKAMGWTS